MDQLFFCFGPPKSGTTYIQCLLNSHPEISCPSEQHLEFLLRGMEGLFSEYNKGLVLTDQRTGAQGAFQVKYSLLRTMFGDAVRRIAQAAAPNKRVCGLSDNSILNNMPLFKELFPEARFIVIFRHPIPRAVSAWHHNINLSEQENSSLHREVNESAGSYEGWVLQVAKEFRDSVEAYKRTLAGLPNCMHITYEDLLRSDECLRRTTEFLGASSDRKLIRSIRESNEIGAMRAASPRPHFFRNASTDFRDSSISEEVQERVEKITEHCLDFLGYPRCSSTELTGQHS